MLTAPSAVGASAGADDRIGPVTNNFCISGADNPEAVARKVSAVLMTQLGMARQAQVGMERLYASVPQLPQFLC